jgi:hypothetical protein
MNIRLLALLCLFCLLHLAGSLALAEDRIVIDKNRRLLTLFRDDKRLMHCPVSIGINTVTAKTSALDYATPEGDYRILYKKNSKLYSWFLGISYPETTDAWLAFFYGRIDAQTLQRIVTAAKNRRFPPQDTPLGGALGIHGGGVFRKDENGAARDWTRGCVALNDEDMAKLYRLARMGTTVRIFDSSRGFFAMLQPFMQPEMEVTNQMPLERWSGLLLLKTHLGYVELRLWEDRQMVRGIGLSVLDHTGRSILHISDTNADENLDALDEVACFDQQECLDMQQKLGLTGQKADINWNEIYMALRKMVVDIYFMQ